MPVDEQEPFEEECASCGHLITDPSRIIVVEPDEHNKLTEPANLCTICHGSHVWKAWTHPYAYGGSNIELETMAQIGNIILDTLEAKLNE